MRRTLTLTLAALALALAACSGDDGGDEATGSDPVNAADTAETPPCSELPGRPTTEVVDGLMACMDGAETMALGSSTYACPEGRTLHWNDFGWGYSDGTWQAHARPDGQLVPPDADMAACPG